ncbi:MAG TPA: tRNA (adenosine(37)-N6)-dimethylallyltransferase MiaA [Tissierellaceae bacterium]|nr:tRNA (adenosine(37)-N6)-dimethylallyltransferase MiaA [Tissierellaceae bacterium]
MKEKLFVLTGPTAVGKTSLSIALAKKLGGEIISADSMQIYKYMDIGTAKVKAEEMEDVPHHLIDIVYPDEEFTVSDYQKQATKLIKELNHKGRLPIIVGGTGLYINSLVYELQFAKVPPNEELRQRYEELANTYGNEYLHEKLSRIDEESSQRIHVADRKRIIRALEIYEETGKTMTEYNKNFRKETNKYDLAMVCLNMDRAQLYERINKRVDLMLNDGLVEEVKVILKMGYDKESVALQGIGYKEIIMYLDGQISLDRAVELIKQGSRNYAKRQLTWFRRDKRIHWVDVGDFDGFEELINYLTKHVNDKIKP